VQEGLDFPGTVYGVSRDTPASERMARQANWFSVHRDDRLLDGGMPGGNGGSAS
jgi:gamma-carbonic anhydrase